MNRTTTRVSSLGSKHGRSMRLLGLLLALGVTLASGQSQKVIVVQMTNRLQFVPAEVTIKAGETVEWRNTSLLTHTVTADSSKATLKDSVELPKGARPFDSGWLNPGDTFRHTFTVPGTYRYFCIPHEGAKMRGKVLVIGH